MACTLYAIHAVRYRPNRYADSGRRLDFAGCCPGRLPRAGMTCSESRADVCPETRNSRVGLPISDVVLGKSLSANGPPGLKCCVI